MAAISAGILDRQAIVDLNYDEDKLVAVDFNLVGTEDGEFVEVQSSGEEATFTGSQLDEMLALGRNGISALIGAQRAVLARIMVTPPETRVECLCQAPSGLRVRDSQKGTYSYCRVVLALAFHRNALQYLPK